MMIDSNIWCYYFDSSCKENKKVAKEVERVITKDEILINTIVIIEVSHFLVKNLGPRIGKEKIDVFLSFPMKIIDLDFSLMKMSVDMLCDYSHTGIGGRDSTLLASMKQANVKKIMTHDDAFKKIDWLSVVDPVKSA